jgi:fatty-acyl-CoA synthase
MRASRGSLESKKEKTVQGGEPMTKTELDEAPWVAALSVGEVLRQTAAAYPKRDAVVFPALGVRWSWSELDRRADLVASSLAGRGVVAGEHVGIWSMNSPEWVVTQFAVARLGSVLVNINPAYRLHELEESLRHADVASLIVGSPFKTSNFVQMVESLCPEITSAASGSWSAPKLPALKRLVALGDRPGPGWLTWSDLESAAQTDALAERASRIKNSDVYNIQFTSGTTGMPKGAMLTHKNVLMNAFYIGQRVRYTEVDRVCVPVPFYHCFGCVLGTLVCAIYGSAIVVPAPSFDPGATLAAIAEERCTSIYGVPTMFVSQLDHPLRTKLDLSSLRTGIMAGSPCPLPLMQAVIETMGVSQITIGYGLTEASPIITQTSVDDPIEVRVSTVGRPIPGVEVRLVDPLTREQASPGATGELCVRGHGVMAGYYKASEATARVVDSNGWLYTGDLARQCDDSNYKIVGRSKELIIRGGENIYPPEVEEYLHRHRAIAEVAVVGLPDPVYGEVVSAWVVPRPGATITPDEVRAFCRGQIAHFKVPHYIEVVDQLPKTVTGKIRKHVLRDEGIERYGLAGSAAVPTA